MSAPNIDVSCITEVADGAVTARRYGQYTEDGVKQVDSTGGRADVIFLHDAADGLAVSCYVLGIHEVTSGAAFTRGDDLMSDSQGRAIEFAPNVAGRYRSGIALQTVTGAGIRASTTHSPAIAPDTTAA